MGDQRSDRISQMPASSRAGADARLDPRRKLSTDSCVTPDEDKVEALFTCAVIVYVTPASTVTIISENVAWPRSANSLTEVEERSPIGWSDKIGQKDIEGFGFGFG